MLIWVVACSSPQPQRPEAPKEQPAAKSRASIEAQDEEWRRILESAIAGISTIEQENLALSQQYALQGRAFVDRGDFERGREALQKAVQRWPQNWDARRLLDEVDAIIGGNTRSGASDAIRTTRVCVEQALIEIGNHIRAGERLYSAREFDAAVREFEDADFKIKHLPCEVGPLKEVGPRVEESLKRARASAGK